MFEIIISWILKVLVKIAPWVFRWLYSHEKLAGLIDITINSENDGLVVNCADLPDARAWIEITNLSPFKLKLVGTEAVLYWVGRAAEFQSLQRLEISPHAKERIIVETSLNDRQAAHVTKNHELAKPRLYVQLYFESSIRSIHKQRDIQTSNVRLLNCKSA